MTEDDKKLVKNLNRCGFPAVLTHALQAAARIESLSAEVERVTKERDEAQEQALRYVGLKAHWDALGQQLTDMGVPETWSEYEQVKAMAAEKGMRFSDKPSPQVRILEFYPQMKASVEASEARVRALEEALREAEKMFRWYGDLHADASSAKRNYEMADKCAAALEENRRG